LLLISIVVITAFLAIFYSRIFYNHVDYLGYFPYLGEREIGETVVQRLLNDIFNLWFRYTNVIPPCSQVVRVGDSIAYIACSSTITDTIVFPRAGGEKLELEIYIAGTEDSRKVWNTSINTLFDLRNPEQGA